MSKKGVPTPPKRPFSKPPTVLEALLRPNDLNNLRDKTLRDIQDLRDHDLAAKLRQQNIAPTNAQHKQHEDFALKQKIGKENINCDMSESHFPPGNELKWLRNLLMLDAQDPDITHNNRNELIEKIRTMRLADIEKIPQGILADTKDQIAQPKRKINEAFTDNVISQLQLADTKTESSPMMIVELNSAKNKVEPLAIAILKGENGIWLLDPTLQRTFVLNKDDMNGLKKLFTLLLEKEHKECVEGRIVRVFNKEKLVTKNEQNLENRAEPLAQLRDTQKTARINKKEAAIEIETPEHKNKSKLKDKPKPPTG